MPFMSLQIDQYLAFPISKEQKEELLYELKDFSDFEIPEDRRDGAILWNKLELLVQKGAFEKDKDTGFLLPSKYKEYVRDQDGFKIFRVNGPWIHRNLSAIYGHGAHGYVHEFTPHGEIWIAETHHNCKCQENFKNESAPHPLSLGYFNSTADHEIKECKLMSKGLIYWAAHNIALETERRAAYKIDPGEIL
jgi:hypothetical protein